QSLRRWSDWFNRVLLGLLRDAWVRPVIDAGHRLPLSAVLSNPRQGSADRYPRGKLGNRVPLTMGLVGDVKTTIAALLPLLHEKNDRTYLDEALAHYQAARREFDELAVGHAGHKPIHPQYLVKLLSDAAVDDAVFTCDVGTPSIWAARYLKMNGKRRLL